VFYTACYCIVTLAATAIRERDLENESGSQDGFVIAVICMAALFGLFTFTMTVTCVRYALLNLTSTEVLKQRSTVTMLAMLVPRGTVATLNYGVITYPLLRPDESTDSQLSGQTAVDEQRAARDALATRTYAIVKTNAGDNIWDLGAYRNWTGVMGTNFLDWVLPIRQSPCAAWESDESFYEMGPVVEQLRATHRLPCPQQESKSKVEPQAVEMQEVRP
jgi:palmitoyltransferase